MIQDSGCCKKALHVPTTCERRSPKKDASAYRISCIAVRTILAKSAAYGPWNWQPRSASSKASSPQRFPPKACVEPSNGSKPTGSVPSTGLAACAVSVHMKYPCNTGEDESKRLEDKSLPRVERQRWTVACS